MSNLNNDGMFEAIENEQRLAMSSEMLKEAGICCGLECLNCPYDPKWVSGTIQLNNKPNQKIMSTGQQVLTQEQIDLIKQAKAAVDLRSKESDEIFEALIQELGMRDIQEELRTSAELYINEYVNPFNYLFDVVFNMSDSSAEEVDEGIQRVAEKIAQYKEVQDER